MIRICANCGLKMGEKPPLDNREVTHGICPACARKIRNELIWNSLKAIDFKSFIWLMRHGGIDGI